ncbi:hypothetical protein CDL15_Pgr017269 [Punica granatum]|uniref:Uncharacterized protein n=1 Tax=Punica granatum TaxID=22663 RepID=A0A218WR86_PUNGR|nr:hypothetical protein CDL15_Pgr017269 [Punica granatum]
MESEEPQDSRLNEPEDNSVIETQESTTMELVRNTIMKYVTTYGNRPKLPVRRSATNQARDTPSTSKPKKVSPCQNIRQQMYREFQQASRDVGVIIGESGVSYGHLPEQLVRISYTGRYGGQFTNIAQGLQGQ